KTQLLAALALIGSASLVYAADITGKVVLKGTPPPEITIDMASSPDKFCVAAHSTPVTTRHYLVGKDGGLANVLVYVKSGLEGKTFPAPTTEPVLDQIACLRSEEHTSELQSRGHLVCRLLLEKKNLNNHSFLANSYFI